MDEHPDESEYEDTFSLERVFLSAALFEVSLGALALFLGWLIGPDPRASLPQINQWAAVADIAQPVLKSCGWGILAAVPMLLVISVIRRLPFESVRELERLGDTPTMKTLLSLGPAEMVVISLCAGIGEELLFRGWLMSAILNVYKLQPGIAPDAIAPVVVAIGLSAILFGLVHWITHLYAVLATLMGVYFGWLFYATGDLLVPIIAHAAYDAVQFLYGAWADSKAAAKD